MEWKMDRWGIEARTRFGAIVEYRFDYGKGDMTREEAMAECDRLNAELDATPPAIWGVEAIYIYGRLDRYEVTNQGSLPLAEAKAECDRLNAAL